MRNQILTPALTALSILLSDTCRQDLILNDPSRAKEKIIHTQQRGELKRVLDPSFESFDETDSDLDFEKSLDELKKS